MATQTTNILHPTAQTFDRDVLRADQPVLVDFTASWCPPCRALKPRIEAMAVELAGRARVAVIDVDQEPQLAARYDIRSIPALRVFRGGQIVASANGALPAPQLSELVERVL